jgi:aspartyl-tRNA(Asn)/glutamyl-tRNA(Gln) amidotransferase subunit A
VADPLSTLSEFIDSVHQVPVADSIPPVLSPAQTPGIEIAIAVNQNSLEPENLSNDPADFGITQLQSAYQSGSITPSALVEKLLSRMQEREPSVQGWVTIATDARQQASECEKHFDPANSHQPLLGIPIGVKDLVDVAGLPTRCGSRQTSTDPAVVDAPAVSRLRDSGAIILGKTTTHEYAFGGTTPPTTNPWQPERIPGGSSGGSGAVLGAGMVPGAIGTDTAGSVRIPASYCGVVGFMGSYGLVPTDHVAVLAWSLDHVGVMARTVGDAAIMHDVVSGVARSTPTTVGLPTTIGIPRSVLDPVHPAVRAAFETAVDALVAKGVEIVDVPWPDPDLMEAVGFILMMAEAAAYHRERMERPELFDPQVAELLEQGATVSAQDHLQALRVRTQLARQFDSIFDRVPIVITPTLPCLPPGIGAGTFTPVDVGGQTQPLATAHTRFTLAANIAGIPAGSLPCGIYENMPIGLQVMGRRGSDLGVLSVMAGMEQVFAQEKLWQPGIIATRFGGTNG